MKKIIKDLLETPQDRQDDVVFYEEALEELEGDNISKGIWAKALASSGGDEVKAKSKYLELRVEILKDEHKKELKIEASRQRAEEDRKKQEEKEANKPSPEEVRKKTYEELMLATGYFAGVAKQSGILLLLLEVAMLPISFMLVDEFGLYDEMTWVVVLANGLVLFTAVVFLIASHRIVKKIDNLHIVKQNIYLVFAFSVILSVLLLLVGVFMPLLLLIGGILLVRAFMNIYKFYRAYRRYCK